MITTKAREGDPKKQSAKPKLPSKTHSVTYVPGLSTLSDLSCIVAQPPSSFLSCLRPPSHHPSSLTYVGLSRTRRPLTSDINTFLAIRYSFILSTCPNHLNILSDLFYSLITPFLFQLCYAPLLSKLYSFATLQPNFSNTSSQEHSLSYSQHFSYPMPLLRTTRWYNYSFI